jgi:translation initiation factor IF-1
MTADQIEAPAKIVEVLGQGAYRAELANGHRCVARSLRGSETKFELGDSVVLAFSPADLSRARLLRRAAFPINPSS